MTLQTAMPLPPGSAITLLLTAQGAQPQFRIAMVNGQPVTAAGQLLAATVASPAVAMNTAAAVAQPPAAAAPPAGITATVLPSPQASAPGAPPSLSPGSSLTLRLVSVEPPASPGESAPPEMPPQTAAKAAQAYGAAQTVATPPETLPPETLKAPVGASSAPATPVAQMPTAQPPQLPTPNVSPSVPAPALQASVSQPATPAAVPSQPSNAPPSVGQTTSSAAASASPVAVGQMLQGVVPEGSRPGSPQLQTPAGLLSLQAAVDLPPGAKVVVQVVSDPAPPQAAPEPEDETAPSPLRKGIEALRAALPQLAEQIEQQLPTLGHARMAFQLLAMTSAVRSGKAAPLLEDEAQGTALSSAAAVASQHRGLLQGLEQELSSLRQTVSLPGSGVDQWQAYVFPFLVEGKPQQMRLVVRDKPDSEAEARQREEEGTRFLIDLDMTHLGPVQLDGLVKGRVKRFDLIIRTHAPLSETLRQGIAEVFVNTLDGFGMTGRTVFQTVPAFIEPLPVGRTAPLPSA